MNLNERELLCLMCNAHDRQQIMQEIHDPEYKLKKQTMGDFPGATDDQKFTIYSLDHTKKYYVGPTTLKVLDLALEEIFFRTVLPSDGIGP